MWYYVQIAIDILICGFLLFYISQKTRQFRTALDAATAQMTQVNQRLTQLEAHAGIEPPTRPAPNLVPNLVPNPAPNLVPSPAPITVSVPPPVLQAPPATDLHVTRLTFDRKHLSPISEHLEDDVDTTTVRSPPPPPPPSPIAVSRLDVASASSTEDQ